MPKNRITPDLTVGEVLSTLGYALFLALVFAALLSTLCKPVHQPDKKADANPKIIMIPLHRGGI